MDDEVELDVCVEQVTELPPVEQAVEVVVEVVLGATEVDVTQSVPPAAQIASATATIVLLAGAR